MKRYLVGGAVRDKLLGLPVKDRDWVVIGSTPDALISAGFAQVGKDFPVFLHPQTKEEHALARTERKSGAGYSGFICDFSPSIRLEDDLARRDLTINAIAEDENGKIVDPYNGVRDLESRVLRHVSPAFSEDPLRVLRIARFFSRLQPLGFTVASETLTLLKSMVQKGELQALTSERVWQELERSLCENAPHKFFELLREINALAIILPELDALFSVPQTSHSDPKNNAGDHTLLALQEAARMSDNSELRFASLCHDFGKALTPKTELPDHPGYEELGLAPIKALSTRLRVPKRHTDLAILASRWHTTIHKIFDLDAAAILDLIEGADGLRRTERFEALLIVCEADSKACSNKSLETYSQRDYLQEILRQLLAMDSRSIVQACTNPREIVKALRLERIKTIDKIRLLFDKPLPR